MRLAILESGHTFGTKLLLALIRTFSRQPVPDAVKLVFYRPDFYGTPMKEITHAAMRGPSEWSVGDRELMAAFVSKMTRASSASELMARSRQGRIATKRKSPPYSPTSRRHRLRSRFGQPCAC